MSLSEKIESPVLRVFVDEVLSESTRRERQILLGVCAIGLVIALGRIVPPDVCSRGLFVPTSQDHRTLHGLPSGETR